MEPSSSSLASAKPPASAPKDKEAGEEVNMEFNLKDDYAPFICKFRAELVKHDLPEIVAGHHVLAVERAKGPKRWMYIKLEGENGETTTLAIRDDNLYLIGFEGKSKKWYEFGISDKSVSIMDEKHEPTFLGYDGSYRCLLEVCPAEKIEGLEVPNTSQEEVGEQESSNRKRKKKTTVKMSPTRLGDGVTLLLSNSEKWTLEHRKAMIGEMVKLELGRRSAMEAVGILSRYTHGMGAEVETQTRQAQTCLVYMFCEATRMIPFFNSVVASWDDTTMTHHIREDQVMYVWYWRHMSAGLLSWRASGYTRWGPHKIINELASLSKMYTDLATRPPADIETAGAALDVVEVIKKTKPINFDAPNSKAKEKQDNYYDGNTPTGAGDDNMPGAGAGGKHPSDQNPVVALQAGTSSNEGQPTMVCFGRPLVEVLGVRAGAGVIVDTVAVFDGKRGQIIYRHHDSPIPSSPSQSRSQGMSDLLLIGPYRAISADGSFAIQVDGSIPWTHASNEPHQVSGDMGWDWDSYSDKAVYDQVSNRDISLGNTGATAVVTYAVLSDAVEATVQVQLKLLLEGQGEITAARVHGEITVTNQHLGDNKVLLFSRTEGEDEQAEVLSSSDGLAVIIPVPLARSVIAAPLDLPLVIEVDLYAACPPKNHNLVPFQQHMEFFLLDQLPWEIERHGVVVQLTSPHIYAPPQQISATTAPDTGSKMHEGIAATNTPPTFFIDDLVNMALYVGYGDDDDDYPNNHTVRGQIYSNLLEYGINTRQEYIQRVYPNLLTYGMNT